jgi:hypothetical protein
MRAHDLLVVLALAVGCRSKDRSGAPETAEPSGGTATTSGDTPTGDTTAPSEDTASTAPSGSPGGGASHCEHLVTPQDVEQHCGAKATIQKTPAEGTKTSAGDATLHHVCHREISFGEDVRIALVVNQVSGGKTAEDVVRGNMQVAVDAGWGQRVDGYTGYFAEPPVAEGQAPMKELHGLSRSMMFRLSASKEAEADWPCSDEGLVALGKLVAERMTPGT